MVKIIINRLLISIKIVLIYKYLIIFLMLMYF